MDSNSSPPVQSGHALVVLQEGKPQQVLSRYLALLLNYRYGLEIMIVRNLMEAFSVMHGEGEAAITCAFVVQNRPIDSRASLAPLNADGKVPLFLVLPSALLAQHRDLCRRMNNVFFCSWEHAFGPTDSSLHKIVAGAFARLHIGDLPMETATMRPNVATERVHSRLAKLSTLPTLPDVVLHIIRVVEDPQTTTDQLLHLLLQDPAIVHKLLQVVRGASIAGAAGRENWTLQEAIVRLGRRQVGAIALQIKLMNSLVKPEESAFDLRRYWRHSLACAVLADRLLTSGRLPLSKPIPFSDYWIACLLHDIGKLVLGFFFWSHFEKLLDKMRESSLSFREAEAELGEQVNHEFLGQVLLERSHVDASVVKAVACHHGAGPTDPPLAWVIHLCDNLTHELGLGAAAQNVVRYQGAALRALHLDEKAARALAAEFQEEIPGQVERTLQTCLGEE